MKKVLLLVLAAAVLIGCNRSTTVTECVTTGGHTYAKFTIDGKSYTLVSEIAGEHLATALFNKGNDLVNLELSVVDNASARNDLSISIGGTTLQVLLDTKHADALGKTNVAFAAWNKQWQVRTKATTARTSTYKVPPGSEHPHQNPIARASRIKDILCFCKQGGISGACLVSTLRCALDKLCDVWGNCVETGQWTPDCSSDLDQAKVCLGEYEG